MTEGEGKIHRIRQGESTAGFAFKCGLLPQTLWNHPQNSELRVKRANPDVLQPGDTIFIPIQQLRHESCATGVTHRFKRKGVPAKLKIRLIDSEERPRANLSYELHIDTLSFSGMTDADGWFEESIPPNATKARLIIAGKENIELALSHLDPPDTPRGIQNRLNNLGYYCGDEDGVLGESSRQALWEFQKEHGLEKTGEADKATLARLEELHQS